DSMGTVLSGIPVTIIGKNKTDLDNVNIFLSNNNAKTEVKKQQFIGGKAIVLPTDENGKLEFYVYPSVKDQFILELESAVMG
ncbi:phage portal protein, partial [Xenorhabdus bovienii]|nr:phage portal protein [Xenorhabdus bovienii]